MQKFRVYSSAIFLASILLCAVSCQHDEKQHKSRQKVVEVENVNHDLPQWLKQNIDSEKSCQIIPCDGINIIKIGNSYTATYTIGSFTFYKADKQKTGLDFDTQEWSIVYFTDSCKLKEDLRWFIKLQMVKTLKNLQQ